MAQLVAKQIKRFNESRDVAEKQDAMRQIYAGALVGHPLARAVVVGGYRSSTLVQQATYAPDVLRMALDFAAKDRPDRNGAATFNALAGFMAEKDAPAFARGVIEAMQDDARLRTPAVAQRVVEAVSALPMACAALAGAADRQEQGCDAGLGEALASLATARGPSGQEEASYKNAERAFARYLQDSL
ncbi:MAG: hypothetical protein ACRCXM_09965 [Beijerinckiaceae bacterium]